MRNPYDVLGVSRSASEADIKKPKLEQEHAEGARPASSRESLARFGIRELFHHPHDGGPRHRIAELAKGARQLRDFR